MVQTHACFPAMVIDSQHCIQKPVAVRSSFARYKSTFFIYLHIQIFTQRYKILSDNELMIVFTVQCRVPIDN